jgi:hypothetical protein
LPCHVLRHARRGFCSPTGQSRSAAALAANEPAPPTAPRPQRFARACAPLTRTARRRSPRRANARRGGWAPFQLWRLLRSRRAVQATAAFDLNAPPGGGASPLAPKSTRAYALRFQAGTLVFPHPLSLLCVQPMPTPIRTSLQPCIPRAASLPSGPPQRPAVSVSAKNAVWSKRNAVWSKMQRCVVKATLAGELQAQQSGSGSVFDDHTRSAKGPAGPGASTACGRAGCVGRRPRNADRTLIGIAAAIARAFSSATVSVYTTSSPSSQENNERMQTRVLRSGPRAPARVQDAR